MSVSVCLDGIFWTAEHFVIKFGLLMEHQQSVMKIFFFFGCLQVQGHREGSYDQSMTFCYTFWTAYSLAFKPGLVVHHYKPVSLERMDHNIQGQGHSEGSIKIWLSNISFELLIPLQLNLVWWHISCIVLWKYWIVLLWSKSRSQERLNIPVNVLPKLNYDIQIYPLNCWSFCN